MGVVRQEVKRSAGRSGFMGSSSLASQAASWMQFFMEGGSGICASGWLGLMAATWTGSTNRDSDFFTLIWPLQPKLTKTSNLAHISMLQQGCRECCQQDSGCCQKGKTLIYLTKPQPELLSVEMNDREMEGGGELTCWIWRGESCLWTVSETAAEPESIM